MKDELVTIPISESEKTSGILSIPDSGQIDTGVILAHGAGNDMNQPRLAFLAEGMARNGYLTLRFNFLYQEKRKKSPDRQEVLYSTWQGAYRFLAEHPDYRPKHIVAAGKSMGGRIASQLVAEKKLPAERLIFLGYPLHAPGKRDKLRDGHLYENLDSNAFFRRNQRSTLRSTTLRTSTVKGERALGIGDYRRRGSLVSCA